MLVQVFPHDAEEGLSRYLVCAEYPGETQPRPRRYAALPP